MNCSTKIIVFLVLALLGFLLFSGCSGTGFDKRATLVPDRIGLSYGEERYRGEEGAWRGITISAGWNLK